MKDFGIASSMRRHALRRRVENEKLHPEDEPTKSLKSSMAEHLMAKMATGGTIEPEEESEDFLTPAMTPEEQGLDQHEVDTYPPSHEFEIDDEKPKKTLGSIMAALRKRHLGT